MKNVGTILLGVLIVALGLFFSGFILALPVMWLWNYVMTSLFHLPQIGYWQAFALYYLSGLLFNRVSSNTN